MDRGKNIEQQLNNTDSAIDPMDMPLSSLARQLEKKTIALDNIPEQVRLECSWYLKNRGRSTAEAARAACLNLKKVQRYFHKKKKEIELKLDPDFQKELVSDLIYSWGAHRKRLLKLCDVENISIAEESKLIYLILQIDKDKIDFLMKLGYLSKAWGENDVNQSVPELRNYSRVKVLDQIIQEEKDAKDNKVS